MKVNILYLSFLLFTLFACTSSDKFLTSKADKLVDDECNCFKSAGISIGDNEVRLLERAMDDNDTSYMNLYDSLTSEEKKDLEKFTNRMSDSASELKNCLYQAEINDLKGLGNSDMDHIDGFIIREARKKPDCRFVLYYNSGSISRIIHMQMAHAIVDQEYNCFKSAGISLSSKVIRFLEKATDSSYSFSTLFMYDDSLTYEEKKQLKNFITLMTDSTSSLRNCLYGIREKATKGMNHPYPDLWTDELARPVRHEVNNMANGGLLRYYELAYIPRIKEMQQIIETADKECDCFQSAQISLKNKVVRVLEEAVYESDPSYKHLYESLTDEEKEELKTFISNVYDSTAALGGCLNKVNKGRHYYYPDTYTYETSSVVERRPDCRLVFYYESGAIRRLKELESAQTR